MVDQRLEDGSPKSYTVFDGDRRIASGALEAVAPVVKRSIEGGAAGPVLIFSDDTGQSIDLDTRGSDGEVVAPHVDAPRGRGRPKLGVVPREVTLLPRHWEWLARQPGGASVALRKLVEEARRTHGGTDRRRRAQERAYHFMSAMAGDRPGFEEAARALFANERPRFEALVGPWPDDIRDHVIGLAFGADDRATTEHAHPPTS